MPETVTVTATATALVPVFENLPAIQMGSDDGFDGLAKGGDFLGRLQLYSKGSAINKELISPGHWGIPEGDDQITDLGKTVDVIPLARRPKAIDLSDTDAIITNYDMDSKEFRRIETASAEQNSGCMYGTSFLVYERTTGRFLEYFCGTKSTRSESKKIFPFLAVTAEDIVKRGLNVEPHGPLPLRMNVKLVEKKKWSWHAPVVVKCSTPFNTLPTRGQVLREMERFLNPSDSGTEKVADTEDGGRAH